MKQLSIIFFILVILFAISCKQRQNKIQVNSPGKFEAFKKKEKFIKDTAIFYPGIADKALLTILNAKMNLATDDFEKLSETGNATDKDYQDKIKAGLERFTGVYDKLDTEDRERVCRYFEELMDIVGLESSGGYLNEFMYGFEPVKRQ